MLTIKEFCEVNQLNTVEILDDGTTEEYSMDRLTWSHGTAYVEYVTATIMDGRRK